MMTILQYFMGLFTTYPAFCAGVVGVVMSLAATQLLKNRLPDDWSERKYRLTVQSIGTVSGWVFGFFAWKLFDPTVGTLMDVFSAMGIGLLSPVLYSLIVPTVVHKFPFLENTLSGRPSGPTKPD